MSVSDLVIAAPWVRGSRSTLFIGGDGAIAADARVVIDQGLPAGSDRYARMAIHPYPLHLVRDWKVGDGRAITSGGAPGGCQPGAGLLRRTERRDPLHALHGRAAELSPALVARFTQIDYDREMALIATTIGDAGAEAHYGGRPAIPSPPTANRSVRPGRGPTTGNATDWAAASAGLPSSRSRAQQTIPQHLRRRAGQERQMLRLIRPPASRCSLTRKRARCAGW